MRNFIEIQQHITDKLKRDLSPGLYFHGVQHTDDVLEAAELIAADEKISAEDLFLLKVAVLYHDAGFIKLYTGHEEVSCQLARVELPGFGLSKEEIEIICGIIMATKIPQQPNTQLERIIADADLAYLGTDDYERISNNLFEELKSYFHIKGRQEWDEMQVSFFNQHHYFTNFGIKHRAPQKQQHLAEIKARL